MNILNHFFRHLSVTGISVERVDQIDAYDPMKIILGKDSTNLLIGDDAEVNVFELLDLPGLFLVFKTNALLISVIVCVIILITMLFIHRAEAFQDKKQDLLHKLLIVFLFSSLVTIFNIVKVFFDNVFLQ